MSTLGDFAKRIVYGDDTKTLPRRTEPHVSGFNDNGVIITDDRGKDKTFAHSEKAETMGDDPLAIYKPTGAKNVDAAKAMGNYSGWVYAAVNAIASEASNMQWRLYQIIGDTHEEVEDHDVLTLLEGVNDHMTGIELKHTILAHLELTGNCYILMDGVKNDTDKPKALYPLNPGRVRVKLNKTVFPFTISHYEFTLDGKVFRFEPYQILHLKYPDPGDPYVGIGVPQTIPTWIDSDNYAMEYNRKFFINGAAIGLYISTDTNVEGQLERIKQGFKDNYSGTENAHKTPVLPKGAKLEHTGTTQRDMDFSKLTEVTRDRILAGFRVSKTILGTAESDTNRATAETADYVFSKRTMKPKMLLVVSFLNEYLVPRYGDNIYLTFIDPVPVDKAARTTEMQAAVGSMPIMTQNEARKNFMGLGPIEGGDKLLMPTSMTLAGTSEAPEGEDVAPQLAKAYTVEGYETRAVRVRTGGKTAFSGTKSMRNALKDAFEKAIDKTGGYEFKSISEMTKAEYGEVYKQFDARTRKAEEELQKIFKSINAEQKKEVIEYLNNHYGDKKVVGDLFDVSKWLNITIDVASPILTSLTKDEALLALDIIGAPTSIDILANAGIRAALDAGIANMAKSYAETTLAQLKDVIGETMTQEGGFTIAELTEKVDDVYAFADENRAYMIAQTESYRATNFANLTAWKESGTCKTVVWYTMEDEKVCDQCEELDGKEVETGAEFFAASYGSGSQPPAHPLCRCGMRPGVISID